MGKRFLAVILAFGVVSVAMGAVAWQGVGAARVSTADSTYIKEDEIIDGSAYVVGSGITIEGTVKGDLYCLGENVMISGKIEGDVLCAGRQITITGSVGDDIRVAAESVVLRGTSEGSVSIAARSFEIEDTTKVGQDLNGGASTARIAGDVGRDVIFGASSMTVVGMIGRDLEGQYETLRIAEGANVARNLSYVSAHDAEVEGSVGGSTTRSEPLRTEGSGSLLGGVVSIFLLVSSLLLVPVMLALLMPNRLRGIAGTVTTHGTQVLLTGLVACFVVPVAFLAFLLTLIGIPLAGVLLIAWILTLLVGTAAVGYLIGEKLFGKGVSSVLGRSFIGGLMLLVLYVVPFLNVLAMMTVSIVGSGMVLTYMYKHKVFTRE